MDTMTDLIRVVDKDNRVVYYNHAMKQVLERNEGKATGHDDFRMTARCLGSGENIQRETYIGETYYSVKTNPIRSEEGEIVGAIEVFRDKSLEKRLQVELIEKIAPSSRSRSAPLPFSGLFCPSAATTGFSSETIFTARRKY